MAKFCFNCGSPLEGSPKFCPSCGTALATATPAQPPQAAPSAPQPPAPATPQMAVPPATPQMPPSPQPQPPVPPMQQPMMAQRSVQAPPMQQPYQGGAPSYGNAPYPGQSIPPGYGYSGEPYIPDEGIAAKFFRYDNRLNRKRYIMRGLILVGIYIVAALVLGFLGAMVDQEVSSLLVLLAGLAIMVPSYMLLIRRLHDLDRPGWWAIGALIPIVNFALSIYVLFIPGTPGPNQYGSDPLTVTN